MPFHWRACQRDETVKREAQVRKCYDGTWDTGISMDGRPWRWAKLNTRRKDVAHKRAPAAQALLIEAFAQEFEVIAATFTDQAAEARRWILRLVGEPLTPSDPEPQK